MSMLSVEVAPECVPYYQAIQRESKYRWISFKISEDERQILVDKHGAPDSTYASLLEALPAGDVRWALVNFQYRTARGPNSKWIPSIKRETLKEAARIKFLGATLTGTVKTAFKAVVATVQANDKDDLEWTNVLSKAAKFERDPVDTEWRPAQDL